jgi:hypothetical protein
LETGAGDTEGKIYGATEQDMMGETDKSEGDVKHLERV